jgi:hypothetical protein
MTSDLMIIDVLSSLGISVWELQILIVEMTPEFGWGAIMSIFSITSYYSNVDSCLSLIPGELYRRANEIHYGSQAQHPFYVCDCPRRVSFLFCNIKVWLS